MKKISSVKWNVDCTIGMVILFTFTLVMLFDFLNYIQYSMLGYDEAYNATVAANYMKYGEYKVSYPLDVLFYNKITTGETVLLPTALLYSLFGINNITTSIVPVMYSVLCVWVIYFLISGCLKENSGARYSISSLIVIALILSDGLYYNISTRLVGETASIFFILLSFTLFHYYMKNNEKQWVLAFVGALVMTSFLTKSATIFIMLSFCGLLLIETGVSKNLTWRGLAVFFTGMILGFVIIESFKLNQLGGMDNFVKWWQNEWIDMLDQSGGVNTSYSFGDKITYLSTIFYGCNKYFCVFMVLFPILIYFYLIYKSTKRNINPNEEQILKNHITMSILGICGSSLIIYFLLFGGSGLFYARRHEINEVLVKISAIYFICYFLLNLLKNIHYNKFYKMFGIVSSIFVLQLIVPLNTVNSNLGLYCHKIKEPSYNEKLMTQFLQEVDNLPQNATLFVAGWWQEPNISLFLDRKMYSIYDVVDNKMNLPENSFFVSGQVIHNVSIKELQNQLNVDFIRYDTSEVDYEKYVTQSVDVFDRKDIEAFALYKIVPRGYQSYRNCSTVSFTAAEHDSGRKYVKKGLSFAEDGFSWSVGNETAFYMLMNDDSKEKYHAVITVDGVINDEQKVIIVANKIEVYSGILKNERQSIDFFIPNNNNGKIDISILIPNAVLPTDNRHTKDPRFLGIRICNMYIGD